MANRAQDWFAQAQRDLQQARASLADQRHEWACFAAYQAAEKAVKALHLSQGQEAFGHVIARLLNDLPETHKAEETLLNKAKVLDNFYIPARYPDANPAGAPFEHYSSLQSEEALKYARAIIDFVNAKLA